MNNRGNDLSEDAMVGWARSRAPRTKRGSGERGQSKRHRHSEPVNLVVL